LFVAKNEAKHFGFIMISDVFGQEIDALLNDLASLECLHHLEILVSPEFCKICDLYGRKEHL